MSKPYASNSSLEITVESTISNIGGSEKLLASSSDQVQSLVINFLQKATIDSAATTYLLRDARGMIVKGSKTISEAGLKSGDILYLSSMESERALFSYTNWWNISLLCALFFVGCVCAGVVGYLLNSPPQDMYGIVIDAGSVHTSISTYYWPGSKFHGTGVIQESYYCEMGEVGISSFADHPSSVKDYISSSCLADSVSGIPASAQSVAVLHLGSTAGMRVLRIRRPEAARQILGNITLALANTGLGEVNATIFSGEDEGVMGWVTANYLKNMFGEFVTNETNYHKNGLAEKDRRSFAALDWGGASSQITVEVDNVSASNDVVELYGKKYPVLTRSHLCYGQAEAFGRYRADLVYTYYQSNGDLPDFLTDPCSPVAANTSLPVREVFSSPCTNTTDETFQRMVAAAGKNVTFVGAGEPEVCSEMSSYAFNYTRCKERFLSLKDESSCLNPAEMPPPGNHTYLAFSTYWYLTQALHLPPGFTLADYEDAVARLCRGGSSTRLPEELYSACFKANFMRDLLVEGYHFDSNTWSKIDIVKRVANAEVGWTLGHMIMASNKIAAQEEIVYISLPVMILLVIIGILFLLLAIFFAYQAKMISSANAKYTRFAQNP